MDVVVPSPTVSPVRIADCRNISAPSCSSGSSSLNAFAIVTPSSQTIGVPKRFASRTDRDSGPRVGRTASARAEVPESSFVRASSRKRTSV